MYSTVLTDLLDHQELSKQTNTHTHTRVHAPLLVFADSLYPVVLL